LISDGRRGVPAFAKNTKGGSQASRYPGAEGLIYG